MKLLTKFSRLLLASTTVFLFTNAVSAQRTGDVAAVGFRVRSTSLSGRDLTNKMLESQTPLGLTNEYKSVTAKQRRSDFSVSLLRRSPEIVLVYDEEFPLPEYEPIGPNTILVHDGVFPLPISEPKSITRNIGITQDAHINLVEPKGVVRSVKSKFSKFFGETLPQFVEVGLAEVINKHLIDRFIDHFKPNINGLIGQVLKTVQMENDLKVLSLYNDILEQVVGRPWPGESFDLLRIIYRPLKQTAEKVITQLFQRVMELLRVVVGDTQGMVVTDVVKAMKRFFGLGKLREHRPVTVMITQAGLPGLLQKKIEQFHADVVYEMAPSMSQYVIDQKDRVVKFAQDAIFDLLMTIVGGSSSIVIKIIRWIAEKVSDLFKDKISSTLVEYSGKVVAEMNKGLRKALYSKFDYLQPDLLRINAEIKG